MQVYSLRRSAFDPEFLEIILDGVVIQEVKVLYSIKKIETSFGSAEEIFAWLEKMETQLAKSAACRLLARRSFSKEGLFQKLREKKFSEMQCRKVVAEMEKMGVLSDLDFGEALLLRKMAQGYGPRYIEKYFEQKGLDPGLVRQRIDEEKQKELLEKWALKMRGKERKQKIAFLLRRGFDFRLIHNICK